MREIDVENGVFRDGDAQQLEHLANEAGDIERLEAGTFLSREGHQLAHDFGGADGDGLDVLKQIKNADPDTLVILLTGYSSIEMAVDEPVWRPTYVLRGLESLPVTL